MAVRSLDVPTRKPGGRRPRAVFNARVIVGSPGRVSRVAILSLACGVLGWIALPIVGAIAAILSGHCAQRAIRRSPGALYGNGFATSGLALGYAQLFLIAMLVGMTHLHAPLGAAGSMCIPAWLG